MDGDRPAPAPHPRRCQTGRRSGAVCAAVVFACGKRLDSPSTVSKPARPFVITVKLAVRNAQMLRDRNERRRVWRFAVLVVHPAAARIVVLVCREQRIMRGRNDRVVESSPISFRRISHGTSEGRHSSREIGDQDVR